MFQLQRSPLPQGAILQQKNKKQSFPKRLPMDPVILPEVRWFHPKKRQNNSLKWYHWMHLDSSSPKKLAIQPTVLGPYKTQHPPKTPRCCWPHCRLLPQLFEEMATIGISVKQQCCFTTQKALTSSHTSWYPNDPCFGWTLGPVLGDWPAKNRGH